jgi:hypothetical protein
VKTEFAGLHAAARAPFSVGLSFPNLRLARASSLSLGERKNPTGARDGTRAVGVSDRPWREARSELALENAET